jgi:hypothetical protein
MNDGTTTIPTTTANCDDAVWEYFVQLCGKSLVYHLLAHACWLYSCQPMKQQHQELSGFVVHYFVKPSARTKWEVQENNTDWFPANKNMKQGFWR